LVVRLTVEPDTLAVTGDAESALKADASDDAIVLEVEVWS
jgi:hypothetical protein